MWGEDYQPMLDNFWNKIRGCCNVAMEGRHHAGMVVDLKWV